MTRKTALTTDGQAVLRANEQFYPAANQLFTDGMKPMVAVWSHAKDVTYMVTGRRIPGELERSAQRVRISSRDEARRPSASRRTASHRG